MADDKKPISRARLVQILTPARKKTISVDKPTLESISATGGKGKPRPPKEIKPAIKSSTAVAGLDLKPEFDKSVERTFTNTINFVANNMGIPNPKPGSSTYEAIRSNLAEKKKAGGLTSTKDEQGNTIYGTTQNFIKDYIDSFNEYDVIKNNSEQYVLGSEDENIRKLESVRIRKPDMLPSVRNPIWDIMGKMTLPLAQGVTGAVTGTAVAGPYGAIPGFLAGAGATFALSAPEATAMKYGTSLEEYYTKARNQGMDMKSAYQAANTAAKRAAGGEVMMQGIFAGLGSGTGAVKSIFNAGKKEALNNLYVKAAKATGNYFKNPLMIGAAAFDIQLASDLEAEQQGIKVESKLSRAFQSGSEFFLLDASIKGLAKLATVPKYIRAGMANLMTDADKVITKQFIAEGEKQGIYPQGTGRKVSEAVNEFKAAQDQSPKFEGDTTRENVVAGLTQKLNKLIDEQSKLAEIHRADLQPQIDDIKRRIDLAKKAEDPLVAEVNDDGTPLIKTQEYATTTTEGKIQESVPEGRVSEYKGSEEVQPVETTIEAEAAKTDIGNRPISSTEEKVSPAKEPRSKKAREKAEAEMEGIKSEDYAELQIVASEKYAKKEVEDADIMAKMLRDYQGQKGDTSSIPDAVFKNIAEETKSPDFKPVVSEPTAKRVKFTFESETDPIRVSARDTFRGMYIEAKRAAKSQKERLSLSAKAIKETLKGTGLDLNENALARSIGKFVSSKMDTDTALQTFMDNLDEIVSDARNVVEKSTARKAIERIIRSSKSPSYGTVAIKEYVSSLDWISPSKINPEMIAEYNRLLEDFNKSITGQIPESATIRKDLIDFTRQQREWSNGKKAERLGNKYDALVRKGEVDPNIVSKDEYIFWSMEPEAKLKPEAEAALKILDESEADIMKDMTTVRQDMLGEYMASDEMSPEYMDAAKEVKGFDVNKVSARNIKLLNNIIEDIMSGERPSRVGEIATDIGAFDALDRMESLRYRTAAGIRTAGVLKIRKVFDKGWEGLEENYKKFGLTSRIRQILFNEKDRNTFRSALLGDFTEKVYRLAKTPTKEAVEEMSNIYTKSNVGSRKFTSARITDVSDTKIGLLAALRQFDDLYTNLETIKNSLIELSRISKSNIGPYHNHVKNTIAGLKSLDLVESVIESEGIIQDIIFKQGKNSQDLILQLNDRELAAYEYGREKATEPGNDLDNAVMDVYGERLDRSNKNYFYLTTFTTGDNRVYDLEESPFGSMPSFVKSMRAGSTYERQPNLVGKTIKGGKNVSVHYDFRFLSNFKDRYNEALVTAHTSRDVKQMSKIINSQRFTDILSGKYNIKPENFVENTKFINDVISTYVNGIRSPHILSTAQIKERQGWSKFLYSRLLYGYGQVFKQSIPAWPYLLSEANGNPMPFINSHKIISQSYLDGEMLDALKTFLNSTAQVDRVAGGLEIFHKELADLDASNFKRSLRKLNNGLKDVFSLSFNLGDTYTTTHSLLIGYMTGLKKAGKLENFHEFDLIKEAKNGFDKDALANAEGFLSQVNNESAAYSKADVLRRSDAPVTRMLQGFGLNQWANFQIDIGVATDRYATSTDRAEALKRVGQYIASNVIFAGVSGTLLNYNLKAARAVLEKYGPDLAPVTEETIEERKNQESLAYWKAALGQGVEMALSGTNILVSQGAKVGLSASLEAIKSYYRDKDERMGIPTSGTWKDKNFSFIYRNNFVGVNGAYYEDLERIYKNIKVSPEGVDYGSEDYRIESQRKTQKVLDEALIFGSVLAPTPDFSTVFRNATRELKNRSINRKEQLASMLWESEMAEDQNTREYYANIYANETKDIKDIKVIEKETLRPLANKLYIENVIAKGAKKFDKAGYKVSDVLYNMSTKNGPALFKILNNRYVGQTVDNNEELKFLVVNRGLTPEEYAITIGMDQDGKPIKGFDASIGSKNFEIMSDRFIRAKQLAMNTKVYVQPGHVGEPAELVELFAKYANQQGLYEDINR